MNERKSSLPTCKEKLQQVVDKDASGLYNAAVMLLREALRWPDMPKNIEVSYVASERQWMIQRDNGKIVFVVSASQVATVLLGSPEFQ